MNALRKVLVFTIAAVAGVMLTACHKATSEPPSAPRIGDTATLNGHTSQGDIENGSLTLQHIVERGESLFTASFNTLDGAGRPETTDVSPDNFRPPRPFPDNFNRISGPDANACSSCHGVPRIGGGGDNATNVFVLADGFHFVNFDAGEGDGFQTHTLRSVGNERTSLGLFGSGYIELLAREMTEDLHAIRDQARKRARDSGAPVSMPLSTKGVDFGTITAAPDGALDTGAVEGVDPDMVIRPFMQKGTIVSLREFAVKAMNQHFGMQASERFGDAVDHDGDGMADELSRGDVSALVIFQAMLPPPGRAMPAHTEARVAAQRGEALFSTLGRAFAKSVLVERYRRLCAESLRPARERFLARPQRTHSPEQAYRDVPKQAENFSTAMLVHHVSIFPEAVVFDMEQAVFYAPVSSHQRQRP